MRLNSRRMSSMRSAEIVGVVGLILFAALMQAQTAAEATPEWQKAAGGKQSFEVASIKLAEGRFAPPNFALNAFESFNGENPHGRLIAQFPLETYIGFAYKLPQYTRTRRDAEVAHVPSWVSSFRWWTKPDWTGGSISRWNGRETHYRTLQIPTRSRGLMT